MPNVLKIRLSLRGRPIRSFTFNKQRVSIGRDPTADVCLDNTGISRDHALIERTPGGYMLEDLGSSNGTFLNEQPVTKDYIGQDDVVQIGKFALWMGVESDRRDGALLGGANAKNMEGTMVIDPDSLLEMQRKSRVDIQEAPSETRAQPSTSERQAGGIRPWIPVLTFLLGTAVGCLATFLIRG